MKTIQKIPLFILIFIPILANAQGLTSLTGAGTRHDIETWLKKNQLRSYNENSSVLGEKYLFEDWREGNVITAEGLTLRGISIKYDLLEAYLILRVNDTHALLDAKGIEEFEIINGQNTLSFRSVEFGGKKHFVQDLFNGKTIALLKKHSVRLERKDPGNQAYGSGVAYDEYVSKKEYFVMKDKAQIIPIKPSKRVLVKLFKDQEEKIKAYIKKNSLDLKEDNDLGELFEYYENIN
ncbi:hypothetical protein [Ekhidna sp.]|uniref:hypothetical protein n=1 Tax=Ekhidna sp. TaxID=2608089 RepID=UPI0032969771